MPTWQNQAYLAQSIDSMLSQSIRNIEVIVIDDCSKDASIDILRHYSKHDKRFRFYQMEDRKGAAFCRNFGNHLAQSEIIFVMDSGDIASADRVEITFEFMRDNPIVDIYSAGCIEVNVLDQQVDYHDPRPFRADEKPSLFHPTVAYKKKVTEEVKYREGNLATDQYEAFFYECAKKGFNFGMGYDYLTKKLVQKKDRETIRKRYEQRVKNYLEFGIPVPKELKDYHKEGDDADIQGS